LGEDFWLWADEVIRGLKDRPGKAITRKDFQQLFDTGRLVISDDLGYTKATTIYEIVEK
jgi:hypothetical protein